MSKERSRTNPDLDAPNQDRKNVECMSSERHWTNADNIKVTGAV